MVEEHRPTPTEVEALKKEVADIKREMMRKELEEIKLKKMRQDLEELKAEEAGKSKGQRQYNGGHKPRLSIVTTIMAFLALLIAGYMLGTLYWFNMAAEVDKYLVSFNLPVGGPIVLTAIAIVLALIGLGLITEAKE